VTRLTPHNKVTVTVNGVPRSIRAGCVRELLERLGQGADRPGIAIAVNGRVVPRSGWNEWLIDDGDDIEIVGAVQGG
jgi:sulfur carrier protein